MGGTRGQGVWGGQEGRVCGGDKRAGCVVSTYVSAGVVSSVTCAKSSGGKV